MHILGTGLTGLIGSRVVSLLSDRFEFQDMSLSTGIDITDQNVVTRAVEASDAPWILHLAAYTNVDEAHAQRNRGVDSTAWRVNVEGTRHVVNAAKKTGKHVIYLSTDFVFDGTRDEYTETDTPNPTGFYGQTKYEGELLVSTLEDHGCIVRTANPYRARLQGKMDFVHAIKKRLSEGHTVQAPSDQVFCPTFVDDVADVVALLIKKQAHGIFHAVGDSALSPYRAAQDIARMYALDRSLVQDTTFASFFEGRSPRPKRAILRNDKIRSLGIAMTAFSAGLAALKKQEQE